MLNILQPGAIFDGSFRVIELVGEGGTGRVYKALELGLNRTVAIKVLNGDLLADREVSQRFKQEGNVLAKLRHPNILTVFKFGRFENTAYIVMEYLSGCSLRTEINANGPLSSEHCVDLALQVCGAMDYAHRRNVVHRDLKPDNIVSYQDSGREAFKIIDFGLARLIPDNDSRGLTETGLLIGSVNYMSPEQCKGEKADNQSDIYSLGCLLFESLSGCPPYDADNPVGIMHHHVNAAVPFLRESIANSAGWNTILHRAMAKDRSARYKSMAEMSADLEALQSGRLTAVAFGDSPRSSADKRKIILLVGLALLFPSIVVIECLRDKFGMDPNVIRPRRTARMATNAQWIHDYSKNRQSIDEGQRVSVLKQWLANFGSRDEEAVAGHFWLCMEMLERANEVGYAHSDPAPSYSLVSPVEQLNEAESERQTALKLIEKLLSSGTSLRLSKPVLRYYKCNLQLLDASPSQQEIICKKVISEQSSVPGRLIEQLRDRLQCIYRAAGEYHREEIIIHQQVMSKLKIALSLAENLARQGKHQESRVVLQACLKDLQSGVWQQAGKRYIHYLAQMLIVEQLFQEAIETCGYCIESERDSYNARDFYRKDSRKCNDPNNHLLLNAIALASLHQPSKATGQLIQISYDDVSTRLKILPQAMLVADELKIPPKTFVSDLLNRPMTQHDIGWLLDVASVLAFGQTTERVVLHAKSAPLHPVNAARLLNKALETTRRLLQSKKLDVETVDRVCRTLTAQGRAAEAFDLVQSFIKDGSVLQSASEEGPYSRRALALDLLHARTLIETGRLQGAAAILARVVAFTRTPKYNYSQEYVFRTSALQARILVAEMKLGDAKKGYRELLMRSRNSLDVSRFQKLQWWSEYASLCKRLGEKEEEQEALKECDRLCPADLSYLIDVEIDR